MKKIFLLLIIIPIFISCKNNPKTADKETEITDIINTDKGIKTLQEFYLTFYGNDTLFANEELKRKFVSERVLKRIDSLSDGENLILDYDPFIQAQDYFGHIIKKTLEIKPLKNKNEYRVSFLLFGEKGEKRIYIDFLLKKNKKGDLLIYSLLNDKYLNFKDNDTNSNKQSNKSDNKLIELSSIKNENELGKLIFYKDNKGKLIINEDLLSEIIKLSDTDHGKKASLLRSYVTQILISRKQKTTLPYTDKELYKIIAYTINTSDPIYYKYYDYDGVFWGKYSIGGDSRGGASFSDALSLAKLLTVNELNKMTAQFIDDNYYNLPNLKNMLDKTFWFG